MDENCIIKLLPILYYRFFKVIHYGAALMIFLGAFFGGFYLSLGINEYKYEDCKFFFYFFKGNFCLKCYIKR